MSHRFLAVAAVAAAALAGTPVEAWAFGKKKNDCGGGVAPVGPVVAAGDCGGPRVWRTPMAPPWRSNT